MLDLFQEIWSTLRQNKLRTTLTGMAVSWGIIIIIVLIGTGNGLMNALMNNASDEIQNIIAVYPGFSSKPYNGIKEGTMMRFNYRDLDFSEQFSEKIDRAFGNLEYSDTISLGSEALSSQIYGVDPMIKDIWRIRMVKGRFVNKNDMDARSKHIIIDENAASQLLGDDKDYSKLLGQFINVGNIPFKVIGIRESEEQSWGHQSYIPYTTAKTMRTDGAWLSRLTLEFH
ncbi:MAG: ABC transporter permease, partial [Bacteroidales bacterium]|nr:ABC transporter permease [Bacteroidales bacterium]